MHQSALSRAAIKGSEVTTLLAGISDVMNLMGVRPIEYSSNPIHATHERFNRAVTDAMQLYAVAVQLGEIVLRDTHATRETVSTTVKAIRSEHQFNADIQALTQASDTLLGMFDQAESAVLAVNEGAERDVQMLTEFAARTVTPAEATEVFEALISRMRRNSS